MRLKCVNIVSLNPLRLAEFYALALNSRYEEIVPGRFEIQTGDNMIVITKASREPCHDPNCCGLEFVVESVDSEYDRLKNAGVNIQNSPQTYPWGWRAFGFKDPDGGNIDFVQPEPIL